MAGVKGMKTGVPREGSRAKGAGRKPKFWDAGTETKKLLVMSEGYDYARCIALEGEGA